MLSNDVKVSPRLNLCVASQADKPLSAQEALNKHKAFPKKTPRGEHSHSSVVL